MRCLCKTSMQQLVTDYDGRENVAGYWYWCPKCGRVFFHSIVYKLNSFWHMPEAIKEVV